MHSSTSCGRTPWRLASRPTTERRRGSCCAAAERSFCTPMPAAAGLPAASRASLSVVQLRSSAKAQETEVMKPAVRTSRGGPRGAHRRRRAGCASARATGHETAQRRVRSARQTAAPRTRPQSKGRCPSVSSQTRLWQHAQAQPRLIRQHRCRRGCAFFRRRGALFRLRRRGACLRLRRRDARFRNRRRGARLRLRHRSACRRGRRRNARLRRRRRSARLRLSDH